MARAEARKTTSQARLLTAAQLAEYFGLTKPALVKMLPTLRKRGLPNPLPDFALYDRKAIDLWLDRVSGITNDGRFNFHPTEAWRLGNKYAPLRHTARMPADLRSKNPYTVAEAVDDYLNWFRQHHKSAEAVTYKCNATILPHFGHRKVEELTPPQIRAWHEAIANTPRTRHVAYGQPRKYMPPPQTDEEKRKRRMTANGDLTVLKAVLNFAFREGKVSSDGAWRVVQAFRGVHRSKAPYLTLEQCQKLIPLCTPDFRLLVCAALLTGARLMELTRLTAEDYNPRAGTVHFAPAKTRWARHVFLTDEGREFFDERVKNLLPGDLLFRRQDGERWRQADPCHRLRIPAREAGLGHISFHIFRHTYASLLAEQGTNMAVIAKNMGHRQTEVCERYYAHLSEGYVAKEIRARLPVLGVKRVSYKQSEMIENCSSKLSRRDPTGGDKASS